MEAGRAYLAEFQVEHLKPVIDTISPFDRLQFDATDLDVKSLRTLLGQATQKGLSGVRLLLITRVEALSEIMQNTLLKILEEPPNELIIILQTTDSSKLLLTVLSRLHNLQLKTTEDILINNEEINPQKIASLTDRNEIIEKLRNLLLTLRANLLNHPNDTIISQIEIVNDTIWRLNKSTNLKLTLDRFLLRWPQK